MYSFFVFFFQDCWLKRNFLNYQLLENHPLFSALKHITHRVSNATIESKWLWSVENYETFLSATQA